MKRNLLTPLIVLSMVFTLQAANAYPLKSLDAPIPVISGVLLSDKEVVKGSDFHATLSEPVIYQTMRLPEGTQFIGHIDNIRHPHRWRRGGMDIWIDQVVFPNGSRYSIYPDEQVTPNYCFKPTFWGKRADTQMDAGGRLYLQFTPSSMNGILQTSMKDKTVTE
jgi:hypothetical protein